MLPSAKILLCRVLVAVLGLVVWAFYYLNARCAYRLPRSWKKATAQFSLVIGSVAVFALQVHVLERWTPEDAYGSFFTAFVVVESGGALAVLFYTLFRERTRASKRVGPQGTTGEAPRC